MSDTSELDTNEASSLSSSSLHSGIIARSGILGSKRTIAVVPTNLWAIDNHPETRACCARRRAGGSCSTEAPDFENFLSVLSIIRSPALLPRSRHALLSSVEHAVRPSLLSTQQLEAHHEGVVDRLGQALALPLDQVRLDVFDAVLYAWEGRARILIPDCNP